MNKCMAITIMECTDLNAQNNHCADCDWMNWYTAFETEEECNEAFREEHPDLVIKEYRLKEDSDMALRGTYESQEGQRVQVICEAKHAFHPTQYVIYLDEKTGKNLVMPRFKFLESITREGEKYPTRNFRPVRNKYKPEQLKMKLDD